MLRDFNTGRPENCFETFASTPSLPVLRICLTLAAVMIATLQTGALACVWDVKQGFIPALLDEEVYT